MSLTDADYEAMADEHSGLYYDPDNEDEGDEYFCDYCGESIGFSPFNPCVCDMDD